MGYEPLVVLAAGNRQTDAFVAGFPIVNSQSSQFRDRVLVVAAAATTPGNLWVDSNDGILVDIAAPGEGVGNLDITGTSVFVLNGTSLAAPLVSGVAGLLFSFDPTLSTTEVHDYIIQGAVAGGQTAGAHPIANAYESLRLAAQRDNAPLCGNAIWVTSRTINVERTPGSTRAIVSDMSGSDFVPDFLRVFHGGRRIDYTASRQTGSTNNTALFALGAWQVGPRLSDTLSSFTGSQRSSLQLSHGGSGTTDTIVTGFLSGTGGDVQTTVELSVNGLRVPLVTIAGRESSQNPFSFSPSGDFVIAALRPPLPLQGNFTYNYWKISVPGGQESLLWSTPLAGDSRVVISEDGKELISTFLEFTPGGNFSACIVEIRSSLDGALRRRIDNPFPARGCGLGVNAGSAIRGVP